MGLKSLSLQILPWCFHMVRQQQQQGAEEGPTPHPSAGSIGTVRLIGSDGRVQIYSRPVSASDLMKEFPRHLVCHSDSFLIGQKVPALSADEKLELGQSYFLLPTAFFHSVLSFVTAASSLVVMMGGPAAGGKKAAGRPFDIRKTEKGMLQIRISEEVLMDGPDSSGGPSKLSRVCDTEELEREYRQLVVAKEWNPKLETIEEQSAEIIRRRWRKWLLARRKKD